MVIRNTIIGRIAWTIIAIWLGIDATVAAEATAQSDYSVDSIVEMPEEHLEEGNTDSIALVAEHVLETARHVSSQA